MRINFDLGDLEAFLAVDTAGSFHGAAQQLALSQSAVTRRIQKLETALDTPLFERTTRAVKPTLAAKRLRPRAEALLQDAAEAALSLRDESVAFAHQRSFVITVAAIPTVIPGLLASALRQFQAAGNSARIRLLDRGANAVSEAVAQGEADFGISSMSGLDPGLQFERLFEDRLVAVLPADHALAALAQVPWSALAQADLILPARGTGNRVLIDDLRAQMGLDLHWSFEAERSTTALALVARGAGLALLPESLLQDVQDARVVWRPMATPRVARPIGLLTRIGQRPQPLIAALKEALRRAANPAKQDL